MKFTECCTGRKTSATVKTPLHIPLKVHCSSKSFPLQTLFFYLCHLSPYLSPSTVASSLPHTCAELSPSHVFQAHVVGWWRKRLNSAAAPFWPDATVLPGCGRCSCCPAQTGSSQRAETGAGCTELSGRPAVFPFVDGEDPCARECYQLAAENHPSSLPGPPATTLQHFLVLIKEGCGRGTAVNTVLSRMGQIPSTVSGSMM